MRKVRSHITGPLPPGSPVYILRKADKEVQQILERMEYVYLSEPHEQGKTSLLYHIRNWFNVPKSAYMVAYVNARALNNHSEADWYKSLKERLVNQLNDFVDCDNLPTPTDASTWRFFLVRLVQSPARHVDTLKPQIIIALDVVEHIPSEWGSSFLLVLREIYNIRSIETEFQRLSFVLSGTFGPDSLIPEQSTSPLLNVAQHVNLEDFDLEQVRSLAAQMQLGTENLDAIATRLYYWTDGQPYLTQKLCRYLEQDDAIVPAAVDRAVDLLLREDTIHLPRITRLLDNSSVTTYLKQIVYQPIRFAPAVNTAQSQLTYVHGILKSDEQGLCRIRNRLYEIALQMGPLWKSWEKQITDALKDEGEIMQETSGIPEFAWAIVTKKYEQKELLPVDVTNERVVLKQGARLVKALRGAFLEASSTLRKKRELDRKGSLKAIADVLFEVFNLRDTGAWRSRGPLQATTLQGNTFASLWSMPREIPLIFIPTFIISGDTYDALTILAGETGFGQHFSFVIPISTSLEEESADVAKLEANLSHSLYDFVILSQETLFDIFTHRDPQASLTRHVTHHVSPYLTSPFIVQGTVPVNTGMFFGRAQEVLTISLGLSSRSFAIIGNRRIGKSSLLSYVKQSLEKQSQQYLVKSTSYQATSTTPEQVRTEIAELEQEANGRTIVQLIDEPDALLEQDAASRYPLSAVWRELSETSRCRFVFAGHRVLRRCVSDVRSPFFNFAEPLPLGFLDQEYARRLLSEPLARIGFHLEEEEKALDLVWRVSAGHPNIIQVIGNSLMSMLSRGKMNIPFAYLEQVLATRDFRRTYEDIMWGGEIVSYEYGVSPLERIILLLGDPDGFTREKIEQSLSLHNIHVNTRDVRDALDFLIDFDLLEQHQRTYTCKVKYFRSMMCENEGIDYLLSLYRKEVVG